MAKIDRDYPVTTCPCGAEIQELKTYDNGAGKVTVFDPEATEVAFLLHKEKDCSLNHPVPEVETPVEPDPEPTTPEADEPAVG